MKTLFIALFCFVFGTVNFSYAQPNPLVGTPQPPPDTLNYNRPGLQLNEVIDFQKSRLLPSDTGEGSASNRMVVWERFWRERVYQNPAAGSGEPNMFDAYHNSARLAAMDRKATSCPAPEQWAGAWKSNGPDSSENQNLGRVEYIWVSPNDTNKMLAATFGGLFKSSDTGSKRKWNCITDNVPVNQSIVCFNHIAVHPQNEDIIYLGTVSYRNRNYYSSGEYPDYGAGILASHDGGITWEQIIIPTGTSATYQDSIQSVNRIFFNPSGTRLYAFQNQRILYKEFPSGSWIDITPQNTPLPFGWNDLEFVPGVPDEFYITGDYIVDFHKKGIIWKYVYNAVYGHTVTPIQVPMLSFNEESSDSLAQIDLSIPNSSSIYLIGRCLEDPNWEGLFRIDRTTQAWTTLQNDLPGGNHGAQSCFRLVVSPHDPNVFYYANEDAYMSVDGGQNYTVISFYYGYPNLDGRTHGDHRYMIAQHWSNLPNSVGDRIYTVNDGGISMKPAGINPLTANRNTFKNINGKGLAIGHLFGLGTSEAGGMLITGGFHDGYYALEPNNPKPWQFISGGDAVDARFSSKDPKFAFGEGWWNGSGGAELHTFTSDASRDISNYTEEESRISPSGEGAVTLPTPTAVTPRGSLITAFYNLWEFKKSPKVYTRVSGANLIPPAGFTDLKLENQPYINDKGVPTFHPIRVMTLHPDKDEPNGYVVFDNKKIYYREPGFTKFESQTTPPTNGRPINDVCMDKNNTKHVWLAVGGFGQQQGPNRYHAVYSPNNGLNWYDISKGLPLVATLKIVHQEGTNILYAGTDVGIYRLDMTNFSASDPANEMSGYNSVEWQCFSRGVAGGPDYPMTYTTDMEINYCSGLLYTCTFGRSVWSTPLWDPNNVPPIEQSNVITTTQAWNDTRYLTTGIRIKPGVTLTLDTGAKIYMPKDGQIWVEPGGQLLVNGALITNGCKDCLWSGIVGEGNSSLAQTATNQARITIQNGAIIEHARNAITTWGGSYNSSGAIVSASGSTFRNNRRAIEFISYHNPHPTTQYAVVPNLSSISRCTFLITNEYRGTNIAYPFSAFISLWDVEGVRLIGNTFTNQNTSASNFGVGIRSFNAGYNVLPACNSPVLPCTNFTRNVFNGLKHGIEVEGDNLTRNTLSVDRAEFQNCGAGIMARTVNNFSVIRSNFKIGNAPFNYLSNCDQNIGIRVLNDCAGFNIDQNDFSQGTAGGPYHYGISLETSGYENKSIYKNSFSKQDYAIAASGFNGAYVKVYNSVGYYLQSGVLISCNTFDNNFEDITIFGNGTIHPIQGSYTLSAGNQFPKSGWLVNNNPNTASNLLQYWNTGGTTLPQIYGALPFTSQTANSCPIRHSDEPILAESPSVRFAGKKSNWIDFRDQFTAQIDAGSTPSLVQNINNSSPANAANLRNQLLGLSPFLSEDALRAVGNGSKLSPSQFTDVLQANTDVLRYPGFLSYLSTNLPEPLPQTTLDVLASAAGTVTARGALEAQMQDAYSDFMQSGNDWLIAIKTDSTLAELDSIPAIYAQMPSLNAQYSLAGDYLIQGDSAGSDAIMAAIPTAFALDATQALEHNGYTTLLNTLKGTDFAHRQPGTLSVAQVATLQGIATGPYGGAGSIAKGAVIFNGSTGSPDVSYPIGCVPVASHRPAGSNSASSKTNVPVPLVRNLEENTRTLSVHPNPAQELATFDYNFAATSGAITLTIRNAAGNTVATFPITENQGSLKWDVRSLPSGSYLYNVADQKRTLATGKVVVVH